MKYYIKTFGCQQNKADSERVESAFKARGFKPAKGYEDANYVIINTCMVRRSAEDRVYGLVLNLGKIKKEKISRDISYKIIVTGCMVGLAFRDKTGEYLNKIRALMPDADEFMPIEEIGFDSQPVRQDSTHAWVPISNGCNNFCTFCVVPFTRGREISRPYEDIIKECKELKDKGYKSVMLLGQNVNSYGADLIVGEKNIQIMRDIDKTYFHKLKTIDSDKEARMSVLNDLRGADPQGEHTHGVKNMASSFFRNKSIKPIYVKHLGRYRIPTLFPYLLEEVAQLGFEHVDFISSNPWDFSDELIDIVAKNQNITRTLHLPVQSGDTDVLKRMNRWYTREEYLDLVKSLKSKVKNLKLTTDIIVGFCGETDGEFQNTVKLAQEVGFEKAYVSIYSERPMTAATKVMTDNVLHAEKRKRWQILEDLINQPYLKRLSNVTRYMLH
ncbi:MAG: radical SAM protein [bacterium]|nr:radical SAM protein [bacterium]